MINELLTLSTYLLAVSLAAERIVAYVKSTWLWLATEKIDANGQPDPVADKKRQMMVHFVALVSYVATSLMNDSWDPSDPVKFDNSVAEIPALLVTILSTGGSAMWTNVVGLLNVLKDIKRQDRANRELALIERSKALGTSRQQFLESAKRN
jgi:hypothetical protein